MPLDLSLTDRQPTRPETKRPATLEQRVAALERAMRARLPAEPLIEAISQALRVERELLVKRIDELPRYVWKGPHVEGTEHSPGHLVQRGGNVWLCVSSTRGVPGKCADFALFVRSGRDGRDGRVPKEPVLR